MDYYKLHIVQTGKPRRSSPPEEYHRFNEEDEEFETLDDARARIRERYGKSRGSPMYRDLKTGGSVRVGTVFGFKNADMSHSPVDSWYQQDWVTLTHVSEAPVLW